MFINTIRQEQLEVFEQESLQQFRAETIADLRKLQSDVTRGLTDEDLGDLIDYGVEVCEIYEVTGESEVRAYVHLMLGFGVDFDEESWAAEVLQDDELDEQEKLEELALFSDEADVKSER